MCTEYVCVRACARVHTLVCPRVIGCVVIVNEIVRSYAGETRVVLIG